MRFIRVKTTVRREVSHGALFSTTYEVGNSAFDCEERVVPSPENQHLRLPAAEVLVPRVIERDTRLIVVKQIELNGGVPGTIEEELVQGVGIRADSLRFRDTVCVLKDGHFFR